MTDLSYQQDGKDTKFVIVDEDTVKISALSHTGNFDASLSLSGQHPDSLVEESIICLLTEKEGEEKNILSLHPPATPCFTKYQPDSSSHLQPTTTTFSQPAC